MRNLFLLLLLLQYFYSFTQNLNPITVHEWGTFTSRYRDNSFPGGTYVPKYSDNGFPEYDLHKSIDEPVPGFVYNLNFNTRFKFALPGYKGGYFLDSIPVNLPYVPIKMETPVLYFYSKKEVKDLHVNVSFPQGSISEFYPLPYRREDTAYVRSKVSMEFDSEIARPNLRFNNYNGFAEWKINILAPDKLIQPTHPDNEVPNLWLAPRKTQSNMIESNGEIEKYIFYRGLAAFINPVIPYYTKSGNLLIHNNSSHEIAYVMVYEMGKDGKRYVWGVSSMKEDIFDMFNKSPKEVSDYEWENSYRKEFVISLTKAGLYEDEAEAMHNTWKHSYFEKPGLKIFWIVPRKFTDEIIPITFSQPIASLERVMVGRTEIMDFNPNNILYYKPDTIPINPNLITKTMDGNLDFVIFPNPTSSQIFINSSSSSKQKVNLRITDFLGRVVYTSEFQIEPDINNSIPCSKLSSGIYNLFISNESVSKNIKLMIN